MSKKFTQEEFINRANLYHNYKYNYNKILYKNINTKINIICPIHGEFLQIPETHLKSIGCYKCSVLQRAKTQTKSKQKFLNEVNIIYNNKYDYSLTTYKSNKTKVKIICPIHHIFEKTINAHLAGQGCPKCSLKIRSINRSDTNKIFIEKATIIHKNKYDYSLINYINNFTKINIICTICLNNFYQKPNSHLSGRGCPICKNTKGWKRDDWVNFCNLKSSTPIVYIIRCFNETENFIKIGITSLNVQRRFNSKTTMPYSYEIIKEIKGSSDFVYDKEKELHMLYKNYKYKPLISFGGETECFNISILSSFQF